LYVMTGNETSSRLSKLNGNIGNLSLAVGTIIENAIGGNSDDKFYDNQYNNKLVGNDGDDWFSVSGGRDTIVGGSGIDRVEIQGQEEDFIVKHRSNSRIIVSHKNDSDYRVELQDVEYITFNNLIKLGVQSDNFDVVDELETRAGDIFAVSSTW
jgi:Ca2+-binding RTX toxin-like protein